MHQPLERTILAEGRHVRLVRQGHWEYAERTRWAGAVLVLAVTDEGNLLLTEQYRIPVGCRVIELPAGIAGDILGQEDEALVTAAFRELLEETGYQAREMSLLTTGPTSAGLSNEIITIFRATGLAKVAPGGGEGSESIEVHEVPLERAAAWLEERSRQGVLVDPKVYAGFYFAERVQTTKDTDTRKAKSAMATIVTIDEAQANLAEIIHQLAAGDEIIITENQQPVAKLLIPPKPVKRRQPGRCKGMITLLVEDDEHLDGFKEYMP